MLAPAHIHGLYIVMQAEKDAMSVYRYLYK